MKTLKNLVVSGLVLATMAATSVPALAADTDAVTAKVNVNSTTATAQQKVVLEKEEAVVPSFTVSVPAKVTLGRDAQDLNFTLDFENDEAFIPDGKKVSVTINSAGYPTALNKFAVWDSKNLQEASYEIYYSDRMAGHRYNIGDEIVSWEGSNHGTQPRRIAVLNYDQVEPGTYNGVINYGIGLVDA